MRSENSELREEIQAVKSDMQNLTERHLDLQSRSMRDNLIFTGIDDQEEENTETVLKDFIKNTLRIEHEISFHRVHRIGRKMNGKSRPIVAKFIFKDR